MYRILHSKPCIRRMVLGTLAIGKAKKKFSHHDSQALYYSAMSALAA